MSMKNVRSAKDRIRRELLENETVLWDGAPDRQALYRRLKLLRLDYADIIMKLSGRRRCIFFNLILLQHL